eukprot:522429-Prymnesium_polylepis.1
MTVPYLRMPCVSCVCRPPHVCRSARIAWVGRMPKWGLSYMYMYSFPKLSVAPTAVCVCIPKAVFGSRLLDAGRRSALVMSRPMPRERPRVTGPRKQQMRRSRRARATARSNAPDCLTVEVDEHVVTRARVFNKLEHSPGHDQPSGGL